MLKELSDTISDPLTRIFKKSLKERRVPKDWKHALVAPIYKKGARYESANYRPISLTCICSKLMEHIICSSMMKHAKENNILYNMQHGFREGRSCETQLNELTHDLVNNMHSGLQTDVCVLDFSKAFDKVGHNRLLEKLKWYGVTGETNDWIRSFLSDRTQAVVVDGLTSSNKSVLSGVPQGSVLGPCLFLYYINDIADNLNSTVRLFADDTMIYLVVTSQSDARRLQQDLDTLTKWEKTWMMEFHPDKCEVISVTRKTKPIIYNYKLHGHVLKHVDCVKYLGVHINKQLNWNTHISHTTSKANKSLNFLRRNINVSNPTIKGRAYKSLVRPILEYAQVVWDPYEVGQIEQLESVQRRAARFTMNNYRRTSSVTTMLTNLEWPLLADRREAARLHMFYKIENNLVATTMPLTPKNNPHHENTRAYVVPTSRTDYHRNSYFYRTARVWNRLPESTVQASTLEAFKGALQK